MHWTKGKLGLYALISFIFLACEATQKTKSPPSSDPFYETDFVSFVDGLSKVQLPFEKSLDWNEELGIPLDTLWVSRLIDPQLYKEECSCMYYQGKVVLDKEKYIAIAFPLEWNAGTTYELRTYSKAGQPIDDLEFAKISETSLIGSINEEGLIRRLAIESFLEKENNGQASNKTRRLEFFQISEEGKFLPAVIPTNSADAWIGQWNLKTPNLGNYGRLNIFPDKPGHIYVNLIHEYNNGNRTRDFAGLALVEGDGTQAASLSHGCLLLYKEENNIKIEGECTESLDADFSGTYLDNKTFPYRYIKQDTALSDDFCYAYQVFDANQQQHSLPKTIQEQINCAGIITLSPDWQHLIFDDPKGISRFHFESKQQRELVRLSEECEGLSDLAWSADGSRAAFVEIQQDVLPQDTRLHIITFKGTAFETQSYDIPVHFFCGGACWSIAYEDFWFGQDGHIYYLDDYKVKTAGDEQDTIEPEILKL